MRTRHPRIENRYALEDKQKGVTKLWRSFFCYNSRMSPLSSKEEKEQTLLTLEAEMNSADFWTDKEKAQKTIKDIQALKDDLSGVGKYDKGDAIMTIFSGAGRINNSATSGLDTFATILCSQIIPPFLSFLNPFKR